MKRLVVVEPGGPERIVLDEAPVPVPGPKDALVAIHVSGVNFIDVYFRTGLYASDRPIVLGSEGAGVVERVGDEVTEVEPGDRVVFAMHRGSHAEYVAVPSRLLAKIPDDVDFRTAGAAMLQGTTAHYLTHSTFPLQAGQTCLVHAAAGGAGGLVVQMAKGRGARVIGTAGTDAKVTEVRALGADHAINYATEDFEDEVRTITGGHGVDVVYDSVGRATFDKGLKVIRPRGMMVLFGQSSGPVEPMSPTVLNTRGSLFLTRPNLAHYVATHDELTWRVNDVMRQIASGQVTIRIGGEYSLDEAAGAYRDLEGRKTTGKLVLKVRS
ncbi:MAG: quinone oxidoreductase [Acidobacteria bacterium]|nr:quinone oxidoreductase [Acidobacteriota bacterium]